MALFRVKLGTGEGKVAIRDIQGASAQDIRDHFTREGYFIFSITRAFEWSSLLGLSKRIPTRKFILFNREFRGLVKAGLPILEGLDLLLSRMKPQRLKHVLEQVRDQVVKGQSLSEAFRPLEGVVPRYYPALLHAGEQSGNLVEVLDRFIEQEERSRKAKKKFLQTLTYPVILMLVAMASMYIILTRALPEFASLYQSTDQEMPWMTVVVTKMSDLLIGYHYYWLAAIVATILLAVVYGRTEQGAAVGERILARIPIAGKLWFLQNSNVFARTMRLLLAGGVPVPQALAITSGAVPSPAFGAQLKAVVNEVSQGEGLQKSLETHTRMGDLAGEMIRVGESTGTLTDMFEYLAENGEEQTEDLLELISNLIAPLVLLVVGLIIAFMVIAMYMPMFGSYQTLGT